MSELINRLAMSDKPTEVKLRYLKIVIKHLHNCNK